MRSDVCKGRPTSGTYDAITNAALDRLDQEAAQFAADIEARRERVVRDREAVRDTGLELLLVGAEELLQRPRRSEPVTGTEAVAVAIAALLDPARGHVSDRQRVRAAAILGRALMARSR